MCLPLTFNPPKRINWLLDAQRKKKPVSFTSNQLNVLHREEAQVQ